MSCFKEVSIFGNLLLFFFFCYHRNLQSNGLTGSLPAELGNLKYLQELRLDRNKLQGTVPADNNSAFTANMHGM